MRSVVCSKWITLIKERKMKEMKKLLAVLMVMAMVLGMSVVANAEGEATTAVLAINDVEEVKAGETVTLKVSASADCLMNAYEFRVTWDTAKFELATETNKYGQYATYADTFPYAGGSKVNNLEAAGSFIWTGANADFAASEVTAGTVIASIELKALADVVKDDVIATLKVAFVTDEAAGVQYMVNMEDTAVALEKTTTPSTSSSSSTTTKKADVTTTTTKAGTTTTATKAAGTTAAAPTTTAKVAADKTGDASNVVALMLVAMVAFGTAVIVYRKKVNA